MRSRGAVAQLGERLPCTQEVSGSIPLSSTTVGVVGEEEEGTEEEEKRKRRKRKKVRLKRPDGAF